MRQGRVHMLDHRRMGGTLAWNMGFQKCEVSEVGWRTANKMEIGINISEFKTPRVRVFSHRTVTLLYRCPKSIAVGFSLFSPSSGFVAISQHTDPLKSTDTISPTAQVLVTVSFSAIF